MAKAPWFPTTETLGWHRDRRQPRTVLLFSLAILSAITATAAGAVLLDDSIETEVLRGDNHVGRKSLDSEIYRQPPYESQTEPVQKRAGAPDKDAKLDASFLSAMHPAGEHERQLQVGADGLVEYRSCVPFDELPLSVIDATDPASECVTGTCGGGCCRIYHWLFCDINNDHPFNACVCNERTATSRPTLSPTVTAEPVITPAPTLLPTTQPTTPPSASPTSNPSATPSRVPSQGPTGAPTSAPTASPSTSPSRSPSSSPSTVPTAGPTPPPSTSPTQPPSAPPTPTPSAHPSASPTVRPTVTPSHPPTMMPTMLPSVIPSSPPSALASGIPTSAPTAFPTLSPNLPTVQIPSTAPTQSLFESLFTTDPSGNTAWESTCAADGLELDSIKNSPLYAVNVETFRYSYRMRLNSTDGSFAPLLGTLEKAIHNGVTDEFLQCDSPNQTFVAGIESRSHQLLTDTATACDDTDSSTDCRSLVVQAPMESVWIATSLSQRRRTKERQLQDSVVGAQAVSDFLSDTIGTFADIDDAILDIEYLGSNDVTQSPTLSPTVETTASAVGETMVPTVSTTEGATTSSNDVDGAERQVSSGSGDDDNIPSPAVIAMAAVAGVAVIALVILVVSRRRTPEEFDDRALYNAKNNDDPIEGENGDGEIHRVVVVPRKRLLAYDMEEATEVNIQQANKSAYQEDVERELVLQMRTKAPSPTSPSKTKGTPKKKANGEPGSASHAEGHLALDTDSEEDSEQRRVLMYDPHNKTSMTPTQKPPPKSLPPRYSPARPPPATTPTKVSRRVTRPLQEQDDLREIHLSQRLSNVLAETQKRSKLEEAVPLTRNNSSNLQRSVASVVSADDVNL